METHTPDHKTILICGTDRQFVEDLHQTIKKSPLRDNFTVVTTTSYEELLSDVLENRIDIDLVILEIEYDFDERLLETESVEMELIRKIRDTQQPHTRIVVCTISDTIVNAQRGDFAHEIPAGDRYIKGHGEGQIPGYENDFQMKLKDWLGAF